MVSLLGTELVRVLVGKEQREFTLHKRLLCIVSPYFRENLEATAKDDEDGAADSASLWFADESPEVFELFVFWLYRRRACRLFIDRASHKAGRVAEASRDELHWTLVGLHLFGLLVEVPALQDASMDAIQDLYLRCDWDVTPRFVAYLYGGGDGSCSVEGAGAPCRLRKWAVAMTAWTLCGAGARGLALAGRFQRLFEKYPVLFAEYCAHRRKLAAARCDPRLKNPQLRLPRNSLRAEERFFGFRQCSFHSHRAAVGEADCPLGLGLGAARDLAVGPAPLLPAVPKKWLPRARGQTEREEVEEEAEAQAASDESDTDQDILVPVSDQEDRTFWLAGI